jgi:amidase/nitrilase
MVAESFVLGAAQCGAVFGDKAATVDKTCEWIERAGKEGVDLLVFPETHVPGFPYWRADPPRPKWLELMTDLQRNSLQIGDDALDVLADAIDEANVNVVLGANELDDHPGSETLYNSLFYFDRDGTHLGTHRKLVPTHVERTIWGRGDPATLQTYNTDTGALGGLICYENHMTLAKAALAAKGEEIHAAAWTGFWTQEPDQPGVKGVADSSEAVETSDIYPAMREYAFETQSFVVSASPYLPAEELEDVIGEVPDLSVAGGGSMLINPVGVVQEGPVFGEETLLTHEFERDERRAAKAIFDSQGHYNRWDAVQLLISDEQVDPISEGESRRHNSRERSLSAARREVIAEEHGVPIGAVDDVAAALSDCE